MTEPPKQRPPRAAQPMAVALLLGNNLRAARTWMIAFAVACLAAVAGPIITVAILSQRHEAIILGNGGEMLYAPIHGFSDGVDVAVYEARLVAMGLLDRGPNGPDYPDILRRICTEQSMQAVNAFGNDLAEHFRADGIHQKVEVAKVAAIQNLTYNGEQLLLVQVVGQVMRTGKENDTQYVDATPIRLNLWLRRNPSIFQSAELPYLLFRFEYREISQEEEDKANSPEAQK